MAELPTALPTSDLSFATAGTKTESSPTDKTDGFVLGDYPDEEVVNYRWDAQKQYLDWLEAVRPRVFDDMVEAIDATSPMDLVVWGEDQGWGDGDVLKPTGVGVPTHIATDGRRIYYIVGTTLYAATASATITADIEWSAAATSSVQSISTDGAIVAIIAPTRFKVYNAVTGALIISLPLGGALHDALHGLLCDSDSNDFRVWFGSATGGNKLYEWTLAGGIVLRHTTATPFDQITMTQSSVVLPDLTQAEFIDKTNFGLVGTQTIASLVGSDFWAFGRDDLLAYGGRSSVGAPYHNLANNGRISEPVSTDTLDTTPPALWGDGKLLVKRHAIDERGVAEHYFSVDNAAMALGGQYLFVLSGSFIQVKPIRISKGSLWIRKSDGTDGNFDGRSASGTRLMTRVLW